MNQDKRSKKIIDLNKYDDPIDLSPKNLELGLWLATNRKMIYKIIVIFLAALGAGFLLYSGYGYFYYFVFGQQQDKLLQQDAAGVNLADYRLQNKPIDLIYTQAKVIASNTGSDFVVHLKNSNEKQFATFNFCFTAGDGKSCGTGFILPNEEKNLMVISAPIKTATGNAGFELSNIIWQKLKAGDIPDWNVFQNKHFNFIVTTPKISTYDDNVAYLEFSITNNSSYGYFSVPLNITINQGSEVVAVNRYVVQGLNSQETKEVRLAWPEAVNLNGTINVTPEINTLDNSVYKPYGVN